MFLKVILKVLFSNITQKFTNLLVQLSIFLIDLCVGTYRLSSHARLEAFLIQTKLLNFGCPLLAAENPVPVSVMNLVRAVEVMICVRMMVVGDL